MHGMASQEEDGQMGESGEPCEITSVSTLCIPHVVDVSRATQLALRIFHADAHPSLMGIGAQGKEGFSLFTMLDRCVTQMVRRRPRCLGHNGSGGYCCGVAPHDASHARVLHAIANKPSLLAG